jgi:Ca2+-binding EF-hand superfamily protein
MNMTTRINRNLWNLLVYSVLGLSPTLSLACQDAPVDGSMESTSAAISAEDTNSAFVLTGGEGQRGEARGPGAKERLDRLFQRFDKDGDGKIALKDLPDRLRERLTRADSNNDGQVTRDEITKAWQTAAAEMKKKIDTNGDGVISDAERAKARAAFWDKRFSELDKNRDGALSASEAPARMWDRIKVADSNNDSKVTRAEIDAALASGKLKPMHHDHDHNEHHRGTTKA